LIKHTCSKLINQAWISLGGKDYKGKDVMFMMIWYSYGGVDQRLFIFFFKGFLKVVLVVTMHKVKSENQIVGRHVKHQPFRELDPLYCQGFTHWIHLLCVLIRTFLFNFLCHGSGKNCFARQL